MPKMKLVSNGSVSKTILQRYSKGIYKYDSLTTISLPKIEVPPTIISKGAFPGVEQKKHFCMILHSEMTIEKRGYYSFSLYSDDGSILWIADSMVVNNDGGHRMRRKIDTIALEKGIHPIKLWYFQGHPDMFGFIFKSKYIGPLPRTTPLEFEIPSDVLFGYDAFTLDQTAIDALDEQLNEVAIDQYEQLDIIGHTDNIGSDAYNQTLSDKRAEGVAAYIRVKWPNASLQVNTSGKGELEPIASNNTSDGRAKNRRVSLKFY